MGQKRIGALLSCAGGGLMNMDRIKDFIDKLSAMGYSFLELCVDDRVEVKGEPYYGYLRGKYSIEQLKEIDAYGKSKGIEIIPCAQTLGHTGRLTNLPCYADIVDTDGILLAGEPRTYELIENMFKSFREGLTSKNFNIGYDEAHDVGRGRYLDKHGWVDRFDILIEHLNKVVEIAAKYDFKIHMWSDMFYRVANGGNYAGIDCEVPAEVKAKVPKNVGLLYWGGGDDDVFNHMMKSHKEFGNEIWVNQGFTGTANGFAPFNHMSEECARKMMRQVRENGIDNVIVPLWDDEGHDCPYYAALPALYCTKQFFDGNFDMDSVKKGFKEMFGVEYDHFLLLDLPNKTKFNPDFMVHKDACKSMFFNDPFLGWKDSAVKDELPMNYGEYAKTLEDLIPEFGDYKYLPDYCAKLCRVLELKSDLGVRTREAYQAGDKEALKKLVPDYIECADRVGVFAEAMRSIWMADGVPYGWEIHTIRFAGVQARLKDCARRLTEYLNGQLKEIPELNEEILEYAKWGLQWNRYRDSVSRATL